MGTKVERPDLTMNDVRKKVDQGHQIREFITQRRGTFVNLVDHHGRPSTHRVVMGSIS
jgi:hypothetical protein